MGELKRHGGVGLAQQVPFKMTPGLLCELGRHNPKLEAAVEYVLGAGSTLATTMSQEIGVHRAEASQMLAWMQRAGVIEGPHSTPTITLEQWREHKALLLGEPEPVVSNPAEFSEESIEYVAPSRLLPGGMERGDLLKKLLEVEREVVADNNPRARRVLLDLISTFPVSSTGTPAEVDDDMRPARSGDSYVRCDEEHPAEAVGGAG